MANASTGEDLQAELIARERERAAALVAGDRHALAEMLTEDLVHVHTSGQAHGKAQLLDHATGFLQFHDVSRGPLLVRAVAPDVAIMTGPMTNVVGKRGSDEQITVQAFVTQVWVKRDGAWRIASFHAVRPQDPPSAKSS